MQNYIPRILLAGDPNKLDSKNPIKVQVVGRLGVLIRGGNPS